MKYSLHPLPETYREILKSRTDFILTIVGKDPYPNSPVGIPFCKDSWDELSKDNCSGGHVLAAIGIDLVEAKDKYTSPSELFEKLACEGIAFLNASYHFLDSNNILKKDYCYIEEALTINKPIVEKSKVSILCGQAKIIKGFIDNTNNCIEVVHPDIQNRKYRRTQWESTWLPNVLKETFKLKLEI